MDGVVEVVGGVRRVGGENVGSRGRRVKREEDRVVLFGLWVDEWDVLERIGRVGEGNEGEVGVLGRDVKVLGELDE